MANNRKKKFHSSADAIKYLLLHRYIYPEIFQSLSITELFGLEGFFNEICDIMYSQWSLHVTNFVGRVSKVLRNLMRVPGNEFESPMHTVAGTNFRKDTTGYHCTRLHNILRYPPTETSILFQ